MLFFCKSVLRNLFKSIEILRKSVKVQIGSNGGEIFVVAGLRKKYLTGYQISSSKYYLYTV